jgi:hypothetical protein
MTTYRCTTCGELHNDLPDVGADKPDQWWGVPEEERDERIKLTPDTCIIDDNYFIRGVIEIPLLNSDERFGFGVWVSQKKENFRTYLNNRNSSEIGPFFGWLCTHLAYYEEDTFFLKTKAHFRGNGLRPYIELEPTEHPLAVAQRQGISLDTAWEIVHFYLDEEL